MKKTLWMAVILSLCSSPVWAAQAPRHGTAHERAKVAAIQFSPYQDAPVGVSQTEVNQYKRGARGDLEALIRQAAKEGARLIVTPEFGTVGYPDIPGLTAEEDDFQNPRQAMPFAETMSGPTVRYFGSLARQLRVYLIIGIMEKTGGSRPNLYNTTVAFNPQGQVVAKYRKINLFELEQEFLKAGTRRVYFDTEFGRVGMSTCFDIHFSNPVGELVSQDHIDIMAFSTAWVGKGAMSAYQNAARSHGIYFIAANNVYDPDSGIFNPDGEAQSSMSGGRGIVYGEVGPLASNSTESRVRERSNEVRKSQALEEARPDLKESRRLRR